MRVREHCASSIGIFRQLMAISIAAFCMAANTAWSQWVSIRPEGFQLSMYDIQFPTAETGYGVGWDQDGSLIMRTTDAGTSWQALAVPGVLLFSVKFQSADNGVVAGYDGSCQCGVIAKTTDGGATWSSGVVATSSGLYSISFVGNDTGFVAGYEGHILKTTDRGNNWRKVKTNTTDVFRKIHMADGATGYALAGLGHTYNQPGQLYKTTDGGEHWARIQDYTGSKVFADLWFTSPTTGFMVGHDGHEAIYRTTDGGNTWDSVYTGNADNVLQAVRFVDARTGYAVGTSGQVLRTVDGGSTWTPEASGTSNTLIAIDATNNAVYTAGLDGSMLKRLGPPASVAPGVNVASTAAAGIYPLPVTTQARIHPDKASAGDEYSFQLVNLAGATVLNQSGRLDGDGFTFNRGTLPAGIYTYRLLINHGGMQLGSLVVR